VAKKITLTSMMIAIALVLNYIEMLIPINFGIPGIKIGLANIVSLTTLFILGPIPAISVQIGRILLGGLMFGNGISILYSLSGGLLSIFVMIVIYKIDKPKLSIIGISAIGAVFFNIGQLAIAAFMIQSLNIVYYLPMLIIFGALMGIFVGMISKYLVKALDKWKLINNNSEP